MQRAIEKDQCGDYVTLVVRRARPVDDFSRIFVKLLFLDQQHRKYTYISMHPYSTFILFQKRKTFTREQWKGRGLGTKFILSSSPNDIHAEFDF